MIAHDAHFDAGADGGNIFKLRTSSTTIVGIRRHDLDITKNATAMAWQVWMVLEGPSEPTHFECIMRPGMEFFAKHDPGMV